MWSSLFPNHKLRKTKTQTHTSHSLCEQRNPRAKHPTEIVAILSLLLLSFRCYVASIALSLHCSIFLRLQYLNNFRPSLALSTISVLYSSSDTFLHFFVFYLTPISLLIIIFTPYPCRKTSCCACRHNDPHAVCVRPRNHLQLFVSFIVISSNGNLPSLRDLHV